MTRYKINAQIDPKAENTEGYNVHDFFTTDLLAIYKTPEQAQEVAEAGYRGPDVDGVGCVWTIEEVIL